jgi:hypothetical protein
MFRTVPLSIIRSYSLYTQKAIYICVCVFVCVCVLTRRDEQRRKHSKMDKGGQRISWLGQLERMAEDRMSKKIFTQELERTRRRGIPRKGWKEEVEKIFMC